MESINFIKSHIEDSVSVKKILRDICFAAPYDILSCIQELHIMIGHIICTMIEKITSLRERFDSLC